KNPFNETAENHPDDVNILKCDSAEKDVLFVGNEIFDGKLRCYQDGSWYKMGDITRTEMIPKNGIANVMCVRKQCSGCTPIPVSGDAKFTAGKSNLCTTLKCPKNYWKISSKTYVGTISCSEDFENTWVKENGEALETTDTLECLDEVKCSEFSKLNIACEEERSKQLGCVEIQLKDDGTETTCGERTMFYSLPSETFFHVGGDSIKCNKLGKWEISKNGNVVQTLGVNSTVICANSNPEPKSQSVSVIPNVCQICQADKSKLFECDECSENLSDIEFKLAPDDKFCIEFANGRKVSN
ncbi:hypothetical protein PFISCL1PPCAC_24972, partial [Pristionchus fissidentatus]